MIVAVNNYCWFTKRVNGLSLAVLSLSHHPIQNEEEFTGLKPTRQVSDGLKLWALVSGYWVNEMG